jgi:two-component system, cell cycle response regulator DivK
MGNKILIVDDSDRSRLVFRLLLCEAGYATVEAADGETAFRLAREGRPDLVFMDIQMPVVDGISAVRMLKSERMTKSIPVVAVTSYAFHGNEELLIDEGFVAAIAKPLNPRVLLSLVRSILDRKTDERA